MEAKVKFGEYVRDLRRHHRLTQRDFAEKLGVDFTYISKIENDKLDAPPSEDLIRRMAQILEVESEVLLDMAGKIDPKALQELASEMPEAGVLLRRLQSGKVQKDQIRRLLDEIDDD